MKSISQQLSIEDLRKNLVQREKELYSIEKIGKALSSTLNLDELLNLIMQEITELMNAERSTLFLLDHERGEIWSKIAQKAEVKEIRQKLGKGISGFVAHTGDVVNIPDAYQDGRFDPSTDKKTGFHTRSILCVPVWEPLSHDSKAEVLGVLQVLNKKDGIFNTEDERLLELLATQVAISIANSRLYHQLEKKYNEIDTLYEFEKYLSSLLDLPELLHKILTKTIDHLKAKRVLIYFPLEGLHLCFSVDDEFQKQFEKANEIPAGWLRFVRKPETTKLTNAWLDVEHCYEIRIDPALFKENVLFSKIQLHNNKEGIVIALGILTDNGNDFQDEKRLMALVSQKISRAVELESLRKDLLKKESLSVIGQMMSNIIHDINSPITAIDGFVDLLQEDSLNSEERQEFASIIRQEIKTLMGMSREILDFAKGKTQILPRKSSAKKIVKRLEPTLRQLCDVSSTKLDLNSESTQVIYVDEEKINRVFYNLSKNAVEAMGENGKLWIHIYDDKDMVVFKFRDNGPGIPKEIQNQIFDSFVTSGKETGTGLGLAIVKKIVEEHKGFVDIESMEGKGATFRVSLPVYNKKRIHS